MNWNNRKTIIAAILAILVGLVCLQGATGATRLEKDGQGFAMQGVLRPGNSFRLALTDTGSARTATNFTAKVIRVYCPEDCWIKLGGSTVTVADSTGMLLPGGVIEYLTVGTNTRIAGRAKAVADTLYVTEME